MNQWSLHFKDQYTLIELTDYCTLNCVMCCHNKKEGPHHSPTGFMQFEVFKKIVDELPSKNTENALKLFWLGESLLHPQFCDMFLYLIEKLRPGYKREYIDLHTNALYMEKEVADVLLSAREQLPRITFSLDAIDKNTYKSIRRGGDLEKSLENIEYFLKERIRRGQIYPTAVFQFIVMGKNADETEKFVYYFVDLLTDLKKNLPPKFLNLDINDTIWLKREDVPKAYRETAAKLYIKTMHRFNLKSKRTPYYHIVVSEDNLWDNLYDKNSSLPINLNIKEETHEKEEYICDIKPESEKKFTVRRPCSGPFKTPVIKWDGELSICCFDPAFELSLGNLCNKTFEELWFSEKAEFIRKAHIKGAFDKIIARGNYSKCLECSGLDTPYLSSEEVVMYLEEKKMYDEVIPFLKKMNGL